jgi:hypothetical protein
MVGVTPALMAISTFVLQRGGLMAIPGVGQFFGVNSFWLLDSEKGEARCVVAKAGFAEDEIVPVSKLGEIEYREIRLPGCVRAR